MIKKIFIFIMLIFICSFSTGCVNIKINEELTINKDKTANHTIQILASDDDNMFQERIEEEITNTLNNLGIYNTTQVSEIDHFGIKGSKDFSLEELPNQGNQYFSIQDNSIDYFIFKHMNYTANINVDSFFSEYEPNLITLEDYKFTLNLPEKITNSNAQKVFNNAQSATWHLHRNQNNTIHVEFNVINPLNIVISILLLCSIILFIIIIIYTRNKENNDVSNHKTINKNENSKDNVQYCENCGTEIKSNIKYCPNCGTKQK